MQLKTKVVGALLLVYGLISATPSALSDKPPVLSLSNPKDGLDRNQTMLMNLKTGPRSAGYFILHSVRGADEMTGDIDKALRQIEAVDAAYAKSRNHPDDRYLATTCLKLTSAKQTADQLHLQLEDAWDELKSSIKSTIVSDPNFKP